MIRGNKRPDLDREEAENRIMQVRIAREMGFLEQLPPAQNRALPLLYPDTLILPRKADVARELKVSRQRIQQIDKNGIKRLEKILEDKL